MLPTFSRLRRPTDGRFWGKSQSPAALLPVSGGFKTIARNIQELYLGSLRYLGLDLLETTFALSKIIGNRPH